MKNLTGVPIMVRNRTALNAYKQFDFDNTRSALVTGYFVAENGMLYTKMQQGDKEFQIPTTHTPLNDELTTVSLWVENNWRAYKFDPAMEADDDWSWYLVQDCLGQHSLEQNDGNTETIKRLLEAACA